jgi:hypothetical protein
VNFLQRAVFAVFVVLLLTPLASADDSDGDGYDDPSENYTVWDGADAYPNNSDIHEPVFSTGCDPPVATLDLSEPVTFTCTIGNEGPVALNVLIDVEVGSHLWVQFDPAYYDINTGGTLELQVTLSGLSEGIAMAKLRIFARVNSSASHTVDLPIEVTGEEWTEMNSHSEGSTPPDISFINRLLDDFAEWLTDNTPWQFSSMQSGIILLIGSAGLIGTFRLYIARSVWRRNMELKPTDDQRTEARFDAIRRGGKHDHHIEQAIPSSPEIIIRRKK